MRVTMNIFSGRPNPTWTLPRGKTPELVDRLTAAAPLITADEPSALGFRGFTLDADLEDIATRPVPPRFFVPAADVLEAPPEARLAMSPAAAAATDEQREVARDVCNWLITTAPDPVAQKAGEAAYDSMRQRSTAAATETKKAGKAETAAAKPAVEKMESIEPTIVAPACQPFLTPIQEAFWNNPFVRFRNNCYNYASNFASYMLAQPGRRSNHMYTTFECGNVAHAANSDGYLIECDGIVRVVALAIWPGFDFHWWRLHPGGFWAHKIGTSPVMRFDNRGRILGNGLTPANCDRGPYTVFCGFLFGPLGIEVL